MTVWCATIATIDPVSIAVLTVGILLSGSVATARLLLGRHTPAQTIAGLMLGFSICYLMMFFS